MNKFPDRLWQTLPATPDPIPGGHCASVNGIRLFYVEVGAGPPVVFLHGGLANSDYLGDQARLLARAYRVILVDSRGHGRSTRDQRPLGYEPTADNVVALLNLLKIEKAAIVGAQAVCVGTQLVASAESAASAEYKQCLVSARQ